MITPSNRSEVSLNTDVRQRVVTNSSNHPTLVKNPLDFKKFSEWCSVRVLWKSSSAMWSEVSKSQDLVDYFLNFTSHTQENILRYLKAKMNPRDSGTFYRLVLEVKELYPDEIDINELRYIHTISEACLDLPQTHSLRFFFAMERFREFEEANTYESLPHSFQSDYLPILRCVYGERRIIEILSAWMKSTCRPHLDTVVKIADNWDQCKSLPFEWSVSMFETTESTGDSEQKEEME